MEQGSRPILESLIHQPSLLRARDYGVSEISRSSVNWILREAGKLGPRDKIHQKRVTTSAIDLCPRLRLRYLSGSTRLGRVRANSFVPIFSGNEIGAGGVQSLIGRACRSISDPSRIVGRNYNISAAFHVAGLSCPISIYEKTERKEKGDRPDVIIPLISSFVNENIYRIVSSAAYDHRLFLFLYSV